MISNTEVAMGFPDLWLWLIFVIVGLFLVLLELIIGVETGLDLVVIGSAFILGGLVTWASQSWWLSDTKSPISIMPSASWHRRTSETWSVR